MGFERSAHGGPNMRFQSLKVFDRFWGENYVERHSGQIIARFPRRSKIGEAYEGERWRGSGWAAVQ
jgi:hypothetical protein